ncbi:MAG: hypothetical protein ACKO1I_17905, partial [Microcystis aeruginosa]
ALPRSSSASTSRKLPKSIRPAAMADGTPGRTWSPTASDSRGMVSGSILGRTATLPIFVEQAYKNYLTPAAFSAAAILALLAGVTLIIKEILERKTAHKIHTT